MNKEEIEYWRHYILFGERISNEDIIKVMEMQNRHKENTAKLHALMIKHGLSELIRGNRNEI